MVLLLRQCVVRKQGSWEGGEGSGVQVALHLAQRQRFKMGCQVWAILMGALPTGVWPHVCCHDLRTKRPCVYLCS